MEPTWGLEVTSRPWWGPTLLLLKLNGSIPLLLHQLVLIHWLAHAWLTGLLLLLLLLLLRLVAHHHALIHDTRRCHNL